MDIDIRIAEAIIEVFNQAPILAEESGMSEPVEKACFENGVIKGLTILLKILGEKHGV